MSYFAQIGRRADGRVFVVEDWVAGPLARVIHLGGTSECVALTAAERSTIELVPLSDPAPGLQAMVARAA